MPTKIKITVKKEGRDELFLVEKEEIKRFIKESKFKTIHNFRGGSNLIIGADHDVESVLKDVDNSKMAAITTGKAQNQNMGHALALVVDNNLELFDIGKISEEDLNIED